MATRWDYRGRRSIVTGAASGMGRATAVGLVAAGAEVHALDIRPIEIDGLASAHEVDLAEPDSLAAAIEAVDGPIHCLFGCAGLPHTFPPLQIMEVSWLGTRAVIESVLERMPEGGAIVTVASIGGLGWRDRLDDIGTLLRIADRTEARAWLEARPDLVRDGYSLAKECVIVYTMGRAVELAGRGIRINCTSPGDTVTGMRQDFIDHFGADFWAQLPRPLGRPSEPEEQAATLLYLNSEAASYIVGANVVVDAGSSIAPTFALPPS